MDGRDRWDQWFQDNRANWDDRAALHEAAGYGIGDLVADPAFLSPVIRQDLDRLGDLTGRDVIHLQCHLGTDTVGLARLGARRVVGVDLSPESIRRARLIARRCGAQVDYVESNVYDAREVVQGDFDLVYSSVGVLCWLPDIDGWAGVVASLLRPGGRLVLRDDHPMSMAIGDDVSAGLKVELPYFQRREPSTWEDATSYVTAPAGAPEIRHRRNHQWNHSLGQTVSAVLRAGLVLDSFEEDDHGAWCPWPELMVEDVRGWRLRDDPDRLPLQFAITAHRPGADAGAEFASPVRVVDQG